MGACAVICRNDHCYASRAQKPHFRVKTTKNLRKIAHSDTKLSILCSKGRKMGVPKPKSAQKCRFCARRSTEQHGAARRGREQPPETEQDSRDGAFRHGTTKKETTFRVVSFKNWRLPTLPHGSAVPSAQVSLTSLFGMGRGGSSPLLPP